MLLFDKIGFGFLIVLFATFPIALIIMCYYEARREDEDDNDDGDAEQWPAAWMATAAAPARVELRPVAAPPVVAKKLGYFPYSAEGRRASEKLVCAICLEVFEHGENCSEVPACRHLFHEDCVHTWMKSKTTCPLCRCNIVAGSERLSAADDMV